MALIIAGDRSSSGKTTVTLAMLSFLSEKGYRIQSFKVGPDYIDPMFHRAVSDRPCRNLDPALTSEAYVKSAFARHCQDVEYALVEGVMGLFDGIKKEGSKDFASTAHIARLLELQVLLVIDCARLSGSVGAIAQGYRCFDSRIKIAGVVLNRVGSDRHLQLLEEALEPLNLPVMGILRRQEDIRIPDRHLGLVPSGEIDRSRELFDRLARLAEKCFDWENLQSHLEVRSSNNSRSAPPPSLTKKVKIAVAFDRAFNFYYQDNFDILEELGAKVVFWSPLEDKSIPEGIDGLYFGGGFPEVFAPDLADNKSVLKALKTAIEMGMPAYAECGGLMYLCDRLVDFADRTWQMVGILPATAIMSEKLTIGYRQATALSDSPLLVSGDIVWGHEFHRSELSASPSKPLFSLAAINRGIPTYEGWQPYQLHASYLHLHFGEYRAYLQRFLEKCADFDLTHFQKL